MPRCTVHRRHTVVRSCVRPSVGPSVRPSVGQMCISMTGELEVLIIGPHAKSGILVILNLLKYRFRTSVLRKWLDQLILIALARVQHSRLDSLDDDRLPCTLWSVPML